MSGASTLLGRCGGPLILSFHRIGPTPDPASAYLDTRVGSVPAAFLDETLRLLRSSGYRFVALPELVEQMAFKPRLAAVTFDDGLRDIVDIATAVLRAHKCPATAFVITSTVNATQLLWQHRLYLAWQRASDGIRLRALDMALPTAAGRADDLESLLSLVLRTGTPEILDGLSRRLAEAVGLDTALERQMCRQLYLCDRDIEHLENAQVSLGGHGHHHWRASRVEPSALDRDLLECARVLSHLSRNQQADFGVPHGDLGNDIMARARDAGFRHILDSAGIRGVGGGLAPRVWLWNDSDAAHITLARLWLKQMRASLHS